MKDNKISATKIIIKSKKTRPYLFFSLVTSSYRCKIGISFPSRAMRRDDHASSAKGTSAAHGMAQSN